MGEENKLVYEQESYALRGCIYEVNRNLGCGYLEEVYQDALAIELTRAAIPFEPQKTLSISYKGQILPHFYIPDFICYGKIIVEIKSVRCLTDRHRAQIHNYLTATSYKLGLLVNFGAYPKAEIERVVYERGQANADEK
jgi:GxxExxY protein